MGKHSGRLTRLERAQPGQAAIAEKSSHCLTPDQAVEVVGILETVGALAAVAEAWGWGNGQT